MNSEEAYYFFTDCIMSHETLTIKSGKGGLSYYKNGIFVCHFNARPQSKRDHIGFADFRYDVLRPYLDTDETISAIQKDAAPEVEIRSHKLWCSLHFPLSKLEHIAQLFLKHIITKVNISLEQENTF